MYIFDWQKVALLLKVTGKGEALYTMHNIIRKIPHHQTA